MKMRMVRLLPCLLAAFLGTGCAPDNQGSSPVNAANPGGIQFPPEEFQNRSYSYHSEPFQAGNAKRAIRFFYDPTYEERRNGDHDERILTGYNLRIVFSAWENSAVLDHRDVTIFFGLDGRVSFSDAMVQFKGGALHILTPLPPRIGDPPSDNPLADPSEPNLYFSEISTFHADPAKGGLVESRQAYREYSDEVIYRDDMHYTRIEEGQ